MKRITKNKFKYRCRIAGLMICLCSLQNTYGQQIENKLFVTVASVQLNVQPKTVIGKINKSSQKLGSKETTLYLGTANNLDHKIMNEFQKSGLDCFSELQNYDDISPAVKPKLILKANITAINFDLKGRHLLKNLTGPCSITCKWQIYTVDDKIVPKKSIVQETQVERKKGDYDLILNDLIEASADQLLKNDSFFVYLTSCLDNYLKDLYSTSIEIAQCDTAGTENNSRELLKPAMNSVVTVISNNDFGSGTIISSDGYILTNFHVTGGEKSLKIKTHTGEILQGSLVKSNKDYDMALLKVDGKNFSCLPLAENNYAAEPGDNIYAVGTPLDQQFSQSVSKGVISGIRKINGISFFQTDVTLNSGNSGGPILNEKGQIIGVVTMKMSGKGIEGIGFCLTSAEVIKALNLKLRF